MDTGNDIPADNLHTPPPEKNAFGRWLKWATVMAGGGTEEERSLALSKIQSERCERWKTEFMTYSPYVVFMLKHLKLSGCPVAPENISCHPCDETRSGGFIPEVGTVALCANRLASKKHTEHTLTHELVHLYDQCKFKVDWRNLRHHACSEIRANSLSGDCKLTQELGRGLGGFSKHHQTCVRRRSVISVTANDACPDKATAEQVVNEVFESCFNDTRPFDEIY